MEQIRHTLPGDIERTSMAIIRGELSARGIALPPEAAPVVLRVIHTTADFDYADNLAFTPGAVEAGVAALGRGTPILTDTNMALAGVSKPSLERLGGAAHCFMADPLVARRARTPFRSYVCVGMAAMMIFQVMINVGMCLFVMPVIGLTLPFFSYGGSSVVTMFAAMGIVSGIKKGAWAGLHGR